MKKLTQFNTTYKLVVASLASIISVAMNDLLAAKINSKPATFVLVMSIVVIATLALGILVENLVDNSRLVRRIIAGNDFIEGYWYDLSVDSETRLAKHGVLFNIFYMDNGFHLSGITFNSSGARVATFRSKRAIYQDRVLFYEYESHTEYVPTSIEAGVAQIQFEYPPNSYTGFYFDYTRTISSRVTGIRVSSKSVKDFNGFKTTDDKRAFVVKKIEESNLLAPASGGIELSEQTRG